MEDEIVDLLRREGRPLGLTETARMLGKAKSTIQEEMNRLYRNRVLAKV